MTTSDAACARSTPPKLFRSHVRRLVEYLKATQAPDRQIIDVAVVAARTGKAPPGDWLAIARTPGVPWKQVEKALTV